jgi:hypothetical protein
VQKQVAEAAKAFYQCADERAVLLVRAITGRSWSSPLMFGCPRGGAASMACTLSSIDVYSAQMAAYNDAHCSGSPANGRQDTPWGLQPAFLMSAASS